MPLGTFFTTGRLHGNHETNMKSLHFPLLLLVASFVALFAAFAVVSSVVAAEVPPTIFEDRAAELGVAFEHVTGATGELYFPEIMGSGVALFDADGDGDLDLYLVQGAPFEASAPASGQDASVSRDRLYKNLLAEKGRLAFEDATAASGIRATGYGMGVATGDVDGDGDLDLYLTNFGPNQLWRNRGDGTFEDVTAAAGVDDPRWSVPAAFFDADLDGRLDLYVGQYAAFRLANHKRCVSATGVPDYCSPASYEPEGDRFFRNLGLDPESGRPRFEETSLAWGLGDVEAYALGTLPADFDGDGRLDLYVANDGVPNHLWLNRRAEDGAGDGAGGDPRFLDEALLAGAAVNERGEPEASMGIDAADIDDDGDLDLFMTHLARETNTLYLNDGAAGFDVASRGSGLASASFEMTGFGTSFLDADNDGVLDLLIVNGAVTAIAELLEAEDPYPFHQPNQFFFGRGDGVFVDATKRAGPAFARSRVSRGAAFGDLDNDGDVDVVVSNNRGPAEVLLNLVGQDRPWIGLRLVDANGSDVPGAVAGVRRKGASTLWRLVRLAASYASANDPRLTVGLGEAASGKAFEVAAVEVRWPGGEREIFDEVEAGRYSVLRRGTGRSPGTEKAAGDPGGDG